MKLFPSKNIVVELRDDRTTTLSELRRNTKLCEKLVSAHTSKEFIGQVDDCGFKIISSEIGRGGVCVFIGELQASTGNVEIRISNAFKVMFSILMLMPIIGFGISIAKQRLAESIVPILSTVMVMLFIRFVLIELGFRFISQAGFNKLTMLIGIKQVNQIRRDTDYNVLPGFKCK
jgi:hypothetical protein